MNEDVVKEAARKSTSPVVVLFGDGTAREQAVQFCDCLVERFWSRCAFEISWWSFDLLSETESAAIALEKAVEARLVVIAPPHDGEIAVGTKAWIDRWLLQRRDLREGTLVCLLPENWPAEEPGESHVYLRSVAHRAGMDFLTRVPQTLAEPIPDSLDSYSARADCVTGVLDEILRHRSRPNELSL